MTLIAVGKLKKPSKNSKARRPVSLYPSLIEKKYENFCVALIKEFHTLLKSDLYPRLPEIYAEFDKEFGTRRQDDFFGFLQRIIGKIVIKFGSKVDSAEPGFLKIATETDQWSKAQSQKAIRQVLGVNILEGNQQLTAAVSGWVTQNVDLIKNISASEKLIIEQYVVDAYRIGLSHKELKEGLEDHWKDRDKRKVTWVKGFSVEQRSRLVARDQLGKLNGQISMLRQTSIGVERYTWRTSLDERVRASHVALENKVFYWNPADGPTPPPEIGHPGHDYQCRCYAESDLSGILGFDPNEDPGT